MSHKERVSDKDWEMHRSRISVTCVLLAKSSILSYMPDNKDLKVVEGKIDILSQELHKITSTK